MPRATKAELERRKLEVEIAKLEAEADTARIMATARTRSEANTLSSDDEHHVYQFIGVVNSGSVQYCVQSLTQWARRDPGCDITIIFNSPGGSVIEGLALYDCISELKAKGHTFTTMARGYAASMGGILLQAGDKRIVGPNAHILIHEVSSGAIGKTSEIKDELAFIERLQARCVAILAEKSTLTVQQIKRRWTKTDWWLDADEAVSLGFADEIG